MTATQSRATLPNATHHAGLFDRVWSADTYAGFSRNTRGESATPLLDRFIHGLQGRADKQPRVVELGAGSCDHALQMANSGFDVTAVEYSRAAVTMGEQRLACYPQAKMRILEQDLLDYTMSMTTATLDGVYANSVFHFLTPQERSAVYRRCRVALCEGGLIAISFKAQGDALEARGQCVEETPAGNIVLGDDGIGRLFVARAEPLVQEMREAGFEMLEAVRWSVPDYNILNESGEFVGLMGRCCK